MSQGLDEGQQCHHCNGTGGSSLDDCCEPCRWCGGTGKTPPAPVGIDSVVHLLLNNQIVCGVTNMNGTRSTNVTCPYCKEGVKWPAPAAPAGVRSYCAERNTAEHCVRPEGHVGVHIMEDDADCDCGRVAAPAGGDANLP